MGKVICIYNQKGGVGKTTTVINLSVAMATTGLFKPNILVLDMDPQGNATSGLGVDKYTDKNIYTLLNNQSTLEESIYPSKYKKLSIIPSTPALTGFEIEAISRENRSFILKEILKGVVDQYEYIFIDCPPSLGMLSLNALCASNSVIIPIQTEYYALEGVSQLKSTYDMVKESLNQELEIEGVLLTMYDSRNNLSQDVVFEVQSYFQDQVFNTVIPRNITLAEAPSYGESAISYDKKSRGAKAYIALAKEIKKKN